MYDFFRAAFALSSGETSSAQLVEDALQRIADPAGEGPRAFVAVHAEAARETARAMDTMRKLGHAPSQFAGIPITVKDLFDEAGIVTRAGAVTPDDEPPARADATVVEKLRREGFVVIGRTNMSEFAFTGLGVNPHHGTPSSPWDRATGRLPGGSSSGAAVAVADRMGLAGLGTDTGGSCRIPAALCGVVGWKPTARRVSRDGVLPLSPTLDSVGLLAPDMATCWFLDSFIAEPTKGAVECFMTDYRRLHIGIPRGTILTEDLDDSVARDFERALIQLSILGARIELFDLPELAELPSLNASGGFPAAEAWAWHRARIATHGDRYDPMVRARIQRGSGMLAADYIELLEARARLLAQVRYKLDRFDAVLCPTVPIVAPPIAAVADPAEYNRINMLLLRNTAPWNFFDCCAVSLPMHRAGEAPTGLMVIGEAMADDRIIGAALAIEAAVSAESHPPG